MIATMDIYKNKKILKILIAVCAILIGGVSLYFTNKLANNLAVEETKRMQIWAEATRLIATSDDGDEINFYLGIIQNNNTIPVVMTDEKGEIVSVLNVNQPKKDDSTYFKGKVAEFAARHEPIVIDLSNSHQNIIYYDDSIILKRLALFPFVQLSIIAIFIIVAYFAFSTSRKAEQNRVWVGMSKETAHQLGTPISSLMAWAEILGQNEENAIYVAEMQKDIDRLRMIADRFSKVGSVPDLQETNLSEALSGAVDYMRSRVSSRVNIDIVDNTAGPVMVNLCVPLFNWVIENLTKNAVDAMEGKGNVTIKVEQSQKNAEILVTDSGKGLQKKQFKAVFTPGYTTKERGWGLGLSLSQRIIRFFHKGKIFVLSSEIGVGTTFKIVLPLCENRNN